MEDRKFVQAVSYPIGGDVTVHCMRVLTLDDGTEIRQPFNLDGAQALKQDELQARAERNGRTTWGDDDLVALSGDKVELGPAPAPKSADVVAVANTTE